LDAHSGSQTPSGRSLTLRRPLTESYLDREAKLSTVRSRHANVVSPSRGRTRPPNTARVPARHGKRITRHAQGRIARVRTARSLLHDRAPDARVMGWVEQRVDGRSLLTPRRRHARERNGDNRLRRSGSASARRPDRFPSAAVGRRASGAPIAARPRADAVWTARRFYAAGGEPVHLSLRTASGGQRSSPWRNRPTGRARRRVTQCASSSVITASSCAR